MVGKDEKWSVNSGKWAYSREEASSADGAGKSQNRLAWSAAAGVALLAGGLLISLSLGIVRFPINLFGDRLADAVGSGGTREAQDVPTGSSDTAQLQGENQRLTVELEQQKRLVNELQRTIDQQRADVGSSASGQLSTEYSIVKRTTVVRGGQQLTVSTDHQFEGGRDHWVRATCSLSLTVNGLSYSVELLRRDQPDFKLASAITKSHILRQAGLSRLDVTSLGANCLWLDEMRFSEVDVAGVLPEDLLVSVPAAPIEEADDAPGIRQSFTGKDMVGMDIQTISGTSQGECEVVCINDRRCEAYTYDNWNRLCITKSGTGTLRMEPRSTTVVFSDYRPSLSAVAPTMTMRRDRAFPNQPYSLALTVSYEDCASQCLADGGCVGVNFVKSMGQCQFFAEPSEYQPSFGVTLGYKSQLR